MSANRFKPHVQVLPEDDANRQIALGFILDVTIRTRLIDILQPAGGWRKVLDDFECEHIDLMMRYEFRHMVLLFDLDGDNDRLEDALARIPESLKNRVFIVGVLSEPEKLRGDFGAYEQLGRQLRDGCKDDSITNNPWSHELLRHNRDQLDLMRKFLAPILETI